MGGSNSLIARYGNGATLLIRSTLLALAYQRNRAHHPLAALRAFLRDQLALILRLARLGIQNHLRLTRLELEGADMGLHYKSSIVDAPPWRLPAEFVAMGASGLPEHPLINAGYLTEILGREPQISPEAIPALNQLLLPDGLKARWTGVPRFGEESVLVAQKAKVAVCMHLFYPDLWPIFSKALANIPEAWDLYVSVPSYACTPSLGQIAQEHPNVWFLPCANRGRDVLPFLRWLELGVFDRYDAICKLHTKRSPHVQDGNRWLEQVLHSLLENVQAVTETLQKFRTAQIGLIGPRALLIEPEHRAHKGGNRTLLQTLAHQAALPQSALDSPFFAGTMFWFKPPALARLRALALKETDFPLEMAQTDGTPAHALERLIWPLVEQAGYHVDCVGEQAAEHGPAFVTTRPSD